MFNILLLAVPDFFNAKPDPFRTCVLVIVAILLLVWIELRYQKRKMKVEVVVKRWCLLCGASLSELDASGLRVCVGDEKKKGCGLVYKGEEAGIGELEWSVEELLSHVFLYRGRGR